MSPPIALETTSVELWNDLQSLQIEGVTVDRVIRLSEKSKVKLIISFATTVAVSLFPNALYNVFKEITSHETTINGQQIIGNQVQIGLLINSQVHVNQSGLEANCKANQAKGSDEHP